MPSSSGNEFRGRPEVPDGEVRRYLVQSVRAGIAGPDKNGLHPGTLARQYVLCFVADHKTFPGIDAKYLDAAPQEPCSRLPARAGATVPAAALGRMVRAVVDGVDLGALPPQALREHAVNFTHTALVDEPPRDRRLVGDDDDTVAHPPDAPERFGNTRQEPKLLDTAEMIDLPVDGPVPIQKYGSFHGAIQ